MKCEHFKNCVFILRYFTLYLRTFKRYIEIHFYEHDTRNIRHVTFPNVPPLSLSLNTSNARAILITVQRRKRRKRETLWLLSIWSPGSKRTQKSFFCKLGLNFQCVHLSYQPFGKTKVFTMVIMKFPMFQPITRFEEFTTMKGDLGHYISWPNLVLFFPLQNYAWSQCKCWCCNATCRGVTPIRKATTGGRIQSLPYRGNLQTSDAHKESHTGGRIQSLPYRGNL
jgi:hypothetical protein